MKRTCLLLCNLQKGDLKIRRLLLLREYSYRYSNYILLHLYPCKELFFIYLI